MRRERWKRARHRCAGVGPRARDKKIYMRRVSVDPEAPQRDAIEEAAHWILLGEIVALPTDTLYGLAVDPFNAAAVARLFAAKGRPENRGVPLTAAGRAPIAHHLRPLPGPPARRARP